MPLAKSHPSQIGRYEVRRVLGAGAMGVVYFGRDPELERDVAIKTVRDLAANHEVRESYLQRFKNESRAAARVAHPGIVQVYDVGEDEHIGPFLVFEYVPGTTLKQLLRTQGALPLEQVLRIFDSVCSALDAAHAHGIIHRDIKPDNLLLPENGQAKLADFGVARVPDAALTREGQFLGTPCYAAPEALEGGRWDCRSDIFSLGAVLYEALTGVRAFPGDDAFTVAQKIVHEEPPIPSEVAGGAPVNPAVEAVVMRALSKDPSKRFARAGELASALRAACEGTAPTQQSAMHLPSRNTLPVTARTWLAVLLTVIVFGVMFVLMRAPRAAPATLSHATDASASDASPGPRVDMQLFEPEAGLPTPAEETEVALGSANEALSPMTPHEREEAAKDALEEARRAIAAGRYTEAKGALALARRYDPENPDIESLASQLP